MGPKIVWIVLGFFKINEKVKVIVEFILSYDKKGFWCYGLYQTTFQNNF